MTDIRSATASSEALALAEVTGADKSLGPVAASMLTCRGQQHRNRHTMAKLSAYILTFNEEEKITAAVNSVLWADEVVVVDSFSTDGTAGIATALGARVVQVAFNGFGDLRNRALEACQHEWIFSLDADER